MAEERAQWTSRVGFILAAAGSAVGLGNIWRFSYAAGTEGGGAFILIYLAAAVFIGYPLLVSEISIGRATRKNPIGAFRTLAPNAPWWLVGAIGVLTAFVILSYYSVVAGWTFAYTFESLRGLYQPSVDHAEHFTRHISDPVAPILWHAAFMAITIGVIAMGVVKGIQRVVQVLMPLLFLLAIVIMIRSITLPGAGEGIAFILTPDFSEVTPLTVLHAVAQAFFTISLGMGAMITYGSYLRKKDPIPSSAGTIIGLDTFVAIIAGFAIFPAVFAFGFDPAAGPGLAFITLPGVFTEMPLGAVFGFLFFLLLTIAALTSSISLLEVVVAWLKDEHKWKRTKAAVVVGSAMFTIGVLPSLGYSVLSHVQAFEMNILDLYDWFATSILLPLGGLLTIIFAGYVWGARKLSEEANEGTGKLRFGPGKGFMFLVKVVVPLAVLAVLIAGLYEKFAA